MSFMETKEIDRTITHLNSDTSRENISEDFLMKSTTTEHVFMRACLVSRQSQSLKQHKKLVVTVRQRPNYDCLMRIKNKQINCDGTKPGN